MILALALRLFLALALLAAWQTALQHPIEHVDEHGRFVHLGGADGSDTRGENQRRDGPPDPSEKLGDALASLAASAANAAGQPLALSGAAASIAVRPQGEPPASPAHHYRSQAPPGLL